MRVLVTGHRGYLGPVVVKTLLEHGHDVTGLDVGLFDGCLHLGDEPAIAELRMDIRDVTPADLSRFDGIVHLAALSNDPLGDIDPELTYEINTKATIHLANAARSAGVGRFVFMSSCSNYGAAGDEWLTETSTLNPVTPYAVSKMKAEAGLTALANDCFSPVFLRGSTAYGASPKLRLDLVVNNLVAWAMTTGQVLLKSDGAAWRPLVHAADIAEGCHCALVADRSLIHAEAFNIGRNEDCLQIKDVAELIRSEIAGSKVTLSGEPSHDARTYRVDCSKIKTIGFEPQWSIRRGVAELRDAFQEKPIGEDDLEGPIFKRVARLKALIDAGELGTDLRFRNGRAA